MNEGKIIAQGSPEELAEHPYLVQIQDIHQSNKDEIENMNMDEVELARKETISEADTVSSEEIVEDHSAPVMTDAQISAKLNKFSGANRGLDKTTEKIVGKLLVDEKDENVNAD
jgi:ABC-type proline/glycine betaine transport system ATPase subunit